MRRFRQPKPTAGYTASATASSTGAASATDGGYANSGTHIGDVIYQIVLRSGTAIKTAVASNEHLEAIRELYKVPHRDLAGILPFLSGHVFSAVVTVPEQYEGHRLKDSPLQFIRQELQISVVALRHRGATEWSGGGAISETPLSLGTELLVCGPENAISLLRTRFATA